MKAFHLTIIFLGICTITIAQPANDDPCSAIMIPVSAPDYLGNACQPTTLYTWTGATLTTATPNPSCGTGNFSNIRDVWYKMVVPASGKIRLSFNAGAKYVAVFYKPANCANTLGFVEAKCFAYNNANTTEGVDVTGLNPGTSIYLRLMRSPENISPSGNIKFCAAELINTPAIDNSTRVGIGTSAPLAKLDVVGTAIIRDSMSIGKNLEVKEYLKVGKSLSIKDSLIVGKDFEVQGTIRADQVKITTNAGPNKMMVSDAAGNGTWVSRDSVFSSPWLTSPYNSRDTVVDGTCLRLRHIDAPELTSYILNNKFITVYFRVGSIGPYQLPYTSDAGGATNSINCIFQEGKILIYRHTFNTCRFNSGIAESYPGQPVLVNLPQSLEYRYVIHN